MYGTIVYWCGTNTMPTSASVRPLARMAAKDDTLCSACLAWLFYGFKVKTERTETVITTNHRTLGILHPTIVKVRFATCQCLNELTHGRPRRQTHPFRTLTIHGNPLLSLPYITSVLNGILLFLHQIRIDRLTDSCYSYVHYILFLVCFTFCPFSTLASCSVRHRNP